MKVERLGIEGLLVLTPEVFCDSRGYFFETFNQAKYAELGIAEAFVQDNESESASGILRGLHFQAPPFAQGKLVRVIAGRVVDAAVDIRVGSPTFGKYALVELSAENKKQFWIPAGFAHGFVALEAGTIFAYKVTAPYSQECDGGILWNDPDLAIDWPKMDYIFSAKDQKYPRFREVFKDFSRQRPGGL